MIVTQAKERARATSKPQRDRMEPSQRYLDGSHGISEGTGRQRAVAQGSEGKRLDMGRAILRDPRPAAPG